MSTLNTRIVLRNDSSTNWAAAVQSAGDAGLVLLKGEIGLEFTDKGVKMKVGDGTTKWEELSYFGGEDARVFEATVAEGESHNDALVRVTKDVTLNTHDVGIVAELIATDADGNEKYQHTAYRYNGTAWAAMDGNYNANNVYFDEDMMVTTNIGYITTSNGSGTIPSKGKNLAEVFEVMFVKEQNPTKTDPSVSVTLTGAGSYEVGTVVTGVKYSASFEDGKYSYGPEPTGATVSSWEITDTAGGSYTETSGDLADVTVADGTNFTVTAKATHSAGATPKTNKGNDCTDSSKKIAAGSKSKTSSAITGYRSFFYGVLATSSVEAPLTSSIIRGLTNGGNYNESKSFTLTGSDVEGAKRIVIAIPSNSSRSGLSEVILTSAMNTPVTDSYTKTTSAVEVEGVDGATAVAYNTYVYEPSKIDAGEVHAITLA